MLSFSKFIMLNYWIRARSLLSLDCMYYCFIIMLLVSLALLKMPELDLRDVVEGLSFEACCYPDLSALALSANLFGFLRI